MRKTLHSLGFMFCMISPHIAHAVTDDEMLSMNCYGCHGPDGVSTGASIPSIAGLERRYLMRTMMNYRKGKRASTIMKRIALGYTVSDLRKISGYFSTLGWTDATAELDEEKILRGKKIHDDLCEECHSENGKHQDHEIPRISGQVGNYLYLEMLLYQAGSKSMPQPDKMKERIETLEAEELKDLGYFYASGK